MVEQKKTEIKEQKTEAQAHFKIKHFPVDDALSFAEFTVEFEENEFNQMEFGVNNELNFDPNNPGKDRMLILCLDRSGSMFGSPWDALISASKVLGDRVCVDHKAPFEHFYTLAYDNQIEEYEHHGSKQ